MRPALLATLGAAVANAALPAISAVGNKFFTSDGDQFFLKGIAYQLTPADPLVDRAQCKRDADLMKTLGVNSIRVYHVDPDADHDGCMSVFDDAGIYTLIDLDTFNSYILPEDPYWNQSQYDAYAKVMDTFAGYDNVLGLFVGNEIIAQANQSLAAPFIKAAVRDMKAYRKKKNYREIPIGYSAADIAELRPFLQDYLTCGGNSADNVDFFGLNSYQWCDPTNYKESGYANLEAGAKDFPVPIFFSETGCNTPGPRLFEDQASIFGPDMTKDWSGAIIYEWIEEANHYGLISYGPTVAPTATGANIEGGFSRAGTPTPVAPDFSNLSKQWATLSPTGVKSSNYKASVSTRDCPASTASGWLVDGNVKVPTLGASLGTETYTPAASATGTPTDDATSPTDTPNAVPEVERITGVAAGLMGVMMVFTLWM